MQYVDIYIYIYIYLHIYVYIHVLRVLYLFATWLWRRLESLWTNSHCEESCVYMYIYIYMCMYVWYIWLILANQSRSRLGWNSPILKRHQTKADSRYKLFCLKEWYMYPLPCNALFFRLYCKSLLCVVVSPFSVPRKRRWHFINVFHALAPVILSPGLLGGAFDIPVLPSPDHQMGELKASQNLCRALRTHRPGSWNQRTFETLSMAFHEDVPGTRCRMLFPSTLKMPSKTKMDL